MSAALMALMWLKSHCQTTLWDRLSSITAPSYKVKSSLTSRKILFLSIKTRVDSGFSKVKYNNDSLEQEKAISWLITFLVLLTEVWFETKDCDLKQRRAAHCACFASFGLNSDPWIIPFTTSIFFFFKLAVWHASPLSSAVAVHLLASSLTPHRRDSILIH